jgi:hypothetical protein
MCLWRTARVPDRMGSWSGITTHSLHLPKCARGFDPSGKKCQILDGWTGEPAPLLGGLTFRFALVVDCHKYWPHEEEASRRFQLRPEFLDLWRRFIGVPFEQIFTFD